MTLTPAILRASAKDAAENIMIVDLMRNDLSQVCRPGTVTVDDCLSFKRSRSSGIWYRPSPGSCSTASRSAGCSPLRFRPAR